MKPFADHFSRIAEDYAAHRPRYPEALFEWLASIAPARHCAWDCGTGNGQAALGLARRFELVIATDPSEAQIAHAAREPRLRYAVATAERVPLAAGSMSLGTVAQALHWFDRDAFYAEARRVLVRDGVLALWSYGLCTLGDRELDASLRQFHDDTVGPYWPPERAIVNAGYERLDFPFEEITPPPFAMVARWTLARLAGYLSTWSAVQRAREATGEDPLPALVDSLASRWGDPDSTRLVEWPLSMRVGRP